MKSELYEALAQRLQDAGLSGTACAAVDMIDAAYVIRAMQSRIEALEKDAVRLDYVVDSIGKHGPDAVIGYLIDEDGFVLTGYRARKSIDHNMQSEKGGV